MKQRSDLTYKHNRNQGRHGWLRLTPAYSVKLVESLLTQLPPGQVVLDPFSGSGTTGLCAASHGHDCDLFDINPFLVWLANVKARQFSEDERRETRRAARAIARRAAGRNGERFWTPDIHAIDRWWSAGRLQTLAAIFDGLSAAGHLHPASRDLLAVAFCRLVMDWSNAAFNHQSMSFQEPPPGGRSLDDEPRILEAFEAIVERVVEDAGTPLPGRARCRLADSRRLPAGRRGGYTCVITSPPYPNRMSYIRELRPYMYWLGYVREAKDAGELDWRAIGGTWGCATSRLAAWTPAGHFPADHPLSHTVAGIAERSPLLANYVHKYFEDMVAHFRGLADRMRRGGHAYYIVGNSKFYDTLLPVEALFADLMERTGFTNVEVERIRKRSSKKELFEFVVKGTFGRAQAPTVSLTRPAAGGAPPLASSPPPF